MEKETTVAVTPTKYAFSNNSQESRSITDTLLKSVLKYPSNSRLTFEEESTIYNSLVALLKMGYPFDNALQDRAVQFLKYFTPYFGNRQRSEKFVTDLVHSSAGAPSGFVESICTLLASPFSAVIAETMQLLFISTKEMYAPIRYLLVASDLISRTITAFQPQTRPISGNEEIHSRLAGIINNVIIIADPSWLRSHMITGPVDVWNHLEMVFRKVMIPSSQYVTFLISNRNVFTGHLIESFMILLDTSIKIAPFHLSTLEFILASPIVMALLSCLIVVG